MRNAANAAIRGMSGKGWLGLALSGLMVFTLPACSATTPVASAGNIAPGGAKKAALLMTSSQTALQRGDADAAVRDAEAAVLLTSSDAKARALLGRAYLAAGRFQSADTAFGDALSLDPSLARIAVTRALAQIALGRTDAALASIDQARGHASDADVGLALALAGQGAEAIFRLEAAARAPDADARTRQNLALTYALAGRWNDAAATAALDVPAEKLNERMQRWSQLGQRRDQPMVQVATLLGTIPVADGGQPAALALVTAPVAAPVQIATAEPAPAPVRVEETPAPVQLVATGAPHATATPAPQIRVAAIGAIEARRMPLLLEAMPPAPRAPMMLAPVRTKASAPRPIMMIAQRSAPKIRAGGQFVVQLGAFSSAKRTEAAWTRLNGKARYLTSFTPVGSGFRQGNANLYRLSISGLDTRADAAKLCSRIKASGGDCFVRAVANDRPMRWTMRGGPGEAA